MSTTDLTQRDNTVLFDGPRWVELPGGVGACDIGPYVDGHGVALYRTFIPGGMCSGHIAGAPGTGKSACLKSIAISQRASGKVIHVYLDGTPHGGSNPFLTNFAHFATHGREGAEQVLALAESWAEWRALENVELGLEGEFIPSVARPGIQIIIEDAHEVFADPDHATRWLAVLRIIRKLGIGVLTTSPGLTLDRFGHNRHLRKHLTASNLICFRIADTINKNLVPGLENVDPSQLPSAPGRAVCGAHNLNAPTVPLQAAFTHEWDHHGAAVPVPELDELGQIAADAAHDYARLWSRRVTN